MFDINKIVRKNILAMQPYSSAREEFSGQANIWLDANENPYDTNLNRYPDPFQLELKKAIVNIKGNKTSQLFIGNGSDEIIDLLMRAFCEPQKDKIYIFPPTYGMYEVLANINNIVIENLPLTNNFELPDISTILPKINSRGLLFICSPNNPTGNIYALEKIKEIANKFEGIVVVDEAYIDFAESSSATELLESTPNLVVLQTMSKAYGLAGLRIGMAFTNSKIIHILNKIKPPYNINILSQKKGVDILKKPTIIKEQIRTIKEERRKLIEALSQLKDIVKIYPTAANFILIQIQNSDTIFKQLKTKGIIIRNRSKQIKNCLRISIGTPQQNTLLINSLKEIIK